MRRDLEVVERAVGTGADEGLVDLLAGDLAHRDGVVHDRVGQGDERLHPVERDGAAVLVDGVGVGVLRLEGCRVAFAHIVEEEVVGLESGEFRAQLRPHRRDRTARVEAEVLEAAAAELDVLIGMLAERAGDVEKDILRSDTRRELAFEVVADRLADAEPGLARRRGIDHVGRADAARRTVEGAAAAGVRVGAYQHRARQGVGAVRNHDMGNADLAADIVKALDAEAFYESAAGDVRERAHAVRGRRAVVEDDDDLARIMHLQHLAPRGRQEGVVDEDGGFDIDDDEITRRDLLGPARPREELLYDGHAHRPVPLPRWLLWWPGRAGFVLPLRFRMRWIWECHLRTTSS